MEIINELLDYLIPYGPVSYIAVFLILIICGFGLPLPEDIVLITSGILCAKGLSNIWIMIFVSMMGILIGDSSMFFIGKYFGNRVKNFKVFRYLLNDKVDKKINYIFKKYGDKIIFIARFMPGIRSGVFLTAGIYKYKFIKFILLDGSAALISVPFWVYVGYLFGANIDSLANFIYKFKSYTYIFLALALLFVLIYITFNNIGFLKKNNEFPKK